ncbi:hypothetical protein SCP_1900720 [Sparassis crispa]|uniref:Uncharacterized protein n=1 Tax=Sparassis crispa TaxID=139825 RepID=A0A401H764_9APHY|nr:hypothetical protein SCP_1900720 [Sparassis crispa]GBE90223.1 hypothetical protein SCP_1900720 [Sparassis crispa]
MVLDVVKIVDSHNSVNLVAAFAKMVEGKANQSRCFDHVVNLVAKFLLHQFDVLKGKADEVLNDAKEALHDLAKDLDMDVPEGDDDEGECAEGLKDEREGLSPEEIEDLEESVRPVKLILIKLRKITCAIICSSMKLLLVWLKIITTFKMAKNKILRDVMTR